MSRKSPFFVAIALALAGHAARAAPTPFDQPVDLSSPLSVMLGDLAGAVGTPESLSMMRLHESLSEQAVTPTTRPINAGFALAATAHSSAGPLALSALGGLTFVRRPRRK